MIELPGLPMALIAEQVSSILDTFWPILAVVLGVSVGSYIYRRFVRAAAAGR